jgi:hypothetical protein
VDVAKQGSMMVKLLSLFGIFSLFLVSYDE